MSNFKRRAKKGVVLTFLVCGISLLLFLCVLSIKIVRLNWQLQDTYLDYFRQTSSFVSGLDNETGKLPTDEKLQSWAQRQRLGNFAYSVRVDRLKCGDHGFATAKTDRFVLSFWEGESFECYAAPSGTTSIHPRIYTYLVSTPGLFAVLSVVLAALLSIWCFRITRR